MGEIEVIEGQASQVEQIVVENEEEKGKSG